jgi:hypothetical protein
MDGRGNGDVSDPPGPIGLGERPQLHESNAFIARIRTGVGGEPSGGDDHAVYGLQLHQGAVEVPDDVDSDAFTAVILALHQYTALPRWPVDEDVDLV